MSAPKKISFLATLRKAKKVNVSFKSTLYIPLDVKEIVIAAFKTTESNSILYKRYKKFEALKDALATAIQMHADYISLRIIKEEEKDERTEDL